MLATLPITPAVIVPEPAGATAPPPAGDGAFVDALRRAQQQPLEEPDVHPRGAHHDAHAGAADERSGRPSAAGRERQGDRRIGARLHPRADAPADEAGDTPADRSLATASPHEPCAGVDATTPAPACVEPTLRDDRVIANLPLAATAANARSNDDGDDTATPAVAAAVGRSGLESTAGRGAAQVMRAAATAARTGHDPAIAAATELQRSPPEPAAVFADAAVAASAAHTAGAPAPGPGPLEAAVAAAAAQAETAARATPNDRAPHEGTLHSSLRAPLGSSEFERQLGVQLGVWVREGVQQASLQLHPAELGPLGITIALDGAAAQVDFHAAHARTRDAIEASLPALAAALRDAGFTLAGGGVFGQNAGHAEGRNRQGSSDTPSDACPTPAIGGDAASLAAPPAARWRRGLLDVFA